MKPFLGYRSEDGHSASALIFSVEAWLPEWPYAAVTQAELESAYFTASEHDKARISKMMSGYEFVALYGLMKSDVYGVYLTAGQAAERQLAEARTWLADGDRYGHLVGSCKFVQNRARNSATHWNNAKYTCEMIYMLRSVVETLITNQ